MSLPDHLGRVLELDPAAMALEFRGRSHSWGALGALARDFVARLDEAGLPEGAPIGLIFRNDPALVAAALGVLTSNRCVVTLSPHAGPERLARELEELALPIVAGVEEDLARDEVRAATEGRSRRVVVDIDAGATSLSELDVSVTDTRLLPGVAIEMLTSGTTGRPKRVPLTFDSLEQSLLGAKHYEKGDEKGDGEKAGGDELRLRSGVAIINGPLVHVGGIWRVLQCLADGRSFALLPRFEIDSWLDAVRRHQPKTVSLVPAALRMVMEAELDPADLRSIRAVISGTAPLSAEEAELFEKQYGIPVLTSYGATEFAGGVAGWNMADHRVFRETKRGSVGRAHPGCELRVVDPESGCVRAAGDEGLLEVKSVQLGPASDWIRTTDLAKVDADGFLFILGRADSAIIRGGFKVHPDVVQAALEEHPQVSEAAVVGIADDRLGQVPVAAVVASKAGASIDIEELRAFAKSRLNAYEVPTRIVVVDEMPRTPSLKISQPGVLALFEEEGTS